MDEDETAAFNYAMERYGFDHSELTPERERLVRKSSAYAWQLLRLRLLRFRQDVINALPRPIRDRLNPP